MGIGLVYERANKDAYDMLQAVVKMSTASELGEKITNDIFPTILNKVGETITRSDLVDRNYSRFKIPLTEFGAITEYFASNMIKADNSVPRTNGTIVQDFAINNPDIQAIYATATVHANYPLTIQSERWRDAIDGGNVAVLASMMAIAMQSLYDGITHDHDSLIPALFGSLFTSQLAVKPTTTIRRIPTFNGTNVEQYSKDIFAIFNKAIRDMTQWRRKDFNYMNMDMSDSKSDLVLVAFDNSVGSSDLNSLDVVTSQLNIGAQARAKALGDSLGVEVYEMPSMGILINSVQRAYGIPAFPGMQTADMSNGTITKPYARVKYALVGKGALNVGLKRLLNDVARSARGHFDQTWVEPTIQLAYGAGQCIFFTDADEPEGE